MFFFVIFTICLQVKNKKEQLKNKKKNIYPLLSTTDPFSYGPKKKYPVLTISWLYFLGDVLPLEQQQRRDVTTLRVATVEYR